MAWAADVPKQTSIQQAQLDNIQVVGARNQGVAAIRKDKQHIREEMMTDGRDLVRYTTDVGIADNGRHNKGFAIRGVEGNRVGISIDGVSLPDSEENSLYARYGNFNSGRLSIDPELVRSIDIERGADSFNAGSGALGGNINYRTLNAADVVLPGRSFGVYLKNTYASKRDEWINTAGVGFNGQAWDAVVLYSRRRGHQLESNGQGEDVLYTARGIPDPSSHLHHSYLAKLSYRFDDAHRVGYAFHGQNGSNKVDEKSYALFGSQWREADDQHRRRNHNLFYEYTPESPWIAALRVDVDKQDTDIASLNYKGTRNWTTEAKELDELYDRRMLTDYKRLSLRLDSQPFQAGGEHQLTVKLAGAQKQFDNLNVDTFFVSSGPSSRKSTIQHPVKTHSYSASVLDSVQWNSAIRTRLGVRYDVHQVKPQALSVDCFSCDNTIPKANDFHGLSAVLGLDAALSPSWQLSYDLSTGFRVPSASEMYFTFNHPAGTWKANPDLKAERSVNHALSFRGEGALGKAKITAYHNRYRDFLKEQEVVGQERNPYYDMCVQYGGWNCREFDEKLFMQMVNVDKAIINGIDVQGELDLHTISPLSEGWKLSGGLGYSHGKLSSGTGLLSIQPLKLLAGLGYEQPDGRYGMHAVVTYYGRKKAEDAQVVSHTYRWQDRSYTQHVDAYPYLNKAATVVDVYGYRKLGKQLTLRAGIYNLFDKRYQHWDVLRGINQFSTTNTVDKAGKGLQRFYAPGRNFVVSLEAQF